MNFRIHRVLILAILATTFVAVPALAQFPNAASDNTTFSIGKAIIWVDPPFHGLVNTLPGWDGSNWTTPYLFDSQTTIGHSGAHTDASNPDINGTQVGLAGSWVSDSNFTIHPGEGPGGTREIHTEIYKLDLQEPNWCQNFVGVSIQAGTGMGVNPPSYGEVEALQNSSDFPAESFFQVYVRINTPFGQLQNVDPLLIHHPSITTLPPTVVYIHGLTSAVKVFFANGPNRGRFFGYLRLAGHGVGGGCDDLCGRCQAKDDLDQALEEAEMMPCNSDTQVDYLGTTIPSPKPVDPCSVYHYPVPHDDRPYEPHTPTQN
ncbi:MAG: hypothetical protein AAGC60_06015 [Acidobacteriota bacterium]